MEVSFRAGYAHDYDASSIVTEWQLREPMLRQWDYWDGDGVLLGVGGVWRRDRFYVQARYDMEAGITSGDNDGSRHSVSLSLGFVF